MADADSQQDLGRADFVPTGVAAQYNQRFEVGDKVWVRIFPHDPMIVAYVKKASYNNERGCWIYTVQETDVDGNWHGREMSRKENALERA
ncbi:uncharacterized protein BP5553_09476 [Venustampulla echinocandica]|uniref:Uncharacterized protein n=1 Tax=Venustampulla echinocandica TaxID=2656787 RepID=A0A370TCX3_9HELO|nr:uncharacterized protein BP5553_09476 [Venustampulla echinocandica]RDL32074.1 hypothetical protein BP5553_09476 [Venustampulla echinocandica]